MGVCGFYDCKFYKGGLCADPKPSTAEYCKGTARVKAQSDYTKMKFEFTKEQIDYLLILLREEIDFYRTTSGHVEEAEELVEYLGGDTY